MGENALDVDAGHLLHGGDLLGSQIHLFGLIADTAHTGVHSHQHIDGLAGLDGLVGNGLHVALAHGDGGDVVLDDDVGVHIGGQAQADDLLGGAGFTQGDNLLQGGDSKGLAAVLAQDLGAGHRAVAVTVGLDDADDVAALGLLHDVLDVIVQVGQVDLGPGGTNGFFIHSDTSFRYLYFPTHYYIRSFCTFQVFLVAKPPKIAYSVLV